MRSIKLLTEPSAGVVDRWYVSDGATAVGPVGIELIARGLEAGKVPLESYVRHEAWKVWRPLSELAVVSVDSAAPTPPYHPRPPETIPGGAGDDITQPGRPVFPDEVMPQDVLAGAADLDDALLLLFNAAVVRTGADAGLVHVVRPDGAVVLYAHGPFARDMIGERTSLVDPALAAAAEGNTVVAEPAPGPAGQAVRDRLLHLGISCDAAWMVPVLAGGRLAAAIELGRKAPRLRASELAVVEALVDALSYRADHDAW
ncbi:GAF domain-containing protein [Polyangium sp. y55x31]|uniref:GAF domain-containing protein n=1 Tax=Polyangium sp. y55x31 TaxID=3042688 RepID=UPI0024826E47|nr:GAF domain-containing protein [Polyangium sp. y55x31]MDI1479926.1 GAF domain-containing protein [Polyangium sp. y55x31]